MLDALEGEVLPPVEYLHQRFDDLYDRVEVLRSLVRQRSDRESTKLRGMLAAAEAEMMVALDELRSARPLKITSHASARHPDAMRTSGATATHSHHWIKPNGP